MADDGRAMRIGILTGGGDCPGLNAVIRAIVRKAEQEFGDTVIGFRDGWRGVMERDYEVIDIARCRGILPRGGTILGTSRIQPYMYDDGVDRTRAAWQDLGLDGIIAIGGEGTLGVAHDLYNDGFAVLGVPKTIDNDISATELTFGFDTALSIATDAIDRLHTTAESHDRVMVVEVMGRHVGHIAIRAGIAGGATLTLIPEEPFDAAEVCDALIRRHSKGRFASIVVVAEGAKPIEGTMELPPEQKDKFGHVVLGGISQVLAAEIGRRTGFDTRVTILGHVQRGGKPTAFDRVLSTRFGIAAIDAAHDGAWGQMVALQCDKVVRVQLSDAVGSLKTVEPEIVAVAQQFFAG